MEKKPRVMVVDDEKRNLRLMEALLMPLGYEVILAGNGEEALEKVRQKPPDVVLLDIMMPGIDGFEVARLLKSEEKTMGIPIVMVTALREAEDRVKALEAGADDFLMKPIEKSELEARVRSLLKVKQYYDHMRDYRDKLESDVHQKTRLLREALEKLKRASLDTIFRLSSAAEYKDEDTASHIIRIGHFAALVARRLGLNDRTVETILYASPMHDIGKIGIPDRVLLKPGKLDAGEWKTMKEHTLIGRRILKDSNSDLIKMAEITAVSHHEKWDGSGYPEGLKGAEIPQEGRIVAVADVFDALTSKRPYKEPFPLDRSFAIIEENRGSHFDPEIVDAFFSLKEQIVTIKERYTGGEESLLRRMAGTNGC